MRRKQMTYEECHKMIDGITYKLCSDFNEWYPMNTEYFYKNKSSHDGFNPYCKEATKKRTEKYRESNPDWLENYNKKMYQNKREYYKGNAKRWNKDNEERKRENQKEWQRNNPDKLRKYQIDRNEHKEHDISEDELNELYEYCNSSCMYCGITEEEHQKIHNQKLHKDHAINDGSNSIDNCIMACKSCNSSKHKNNWYEWYIPENPKYNQERYIKVKNWLIKFAI